jgi:DNA-binding response OmpR family regulator
MQGKILVVHRNELILDVIREMLQDLGYAVTQIQDGHRALGKALSDHFHIIIVNHALNGSLTCGQLVERMKKYGVRSPIIGTAPHATWDALAGFSEGIVDYLLPSPFDYTELIKAVESLSKPRSAASRIESPIVDDIPDVPFSEPTLPTESDLLETVADDFSLPDFPPALPPIEEPTAPVPDSPQIHQSPFSTPEAKSPPHILLVETDTKLCKELATHLTGEGYRVSAFHNNREAYEDTMLNDYDLILTDLWLPGLDGFDMIDAMRKSGVCAPIAILTAHITRDMVQELLDYHICRILLKPLKSEDLFALVHTQANERSPFPAMGKGIFCCTPPQKTLEIYRETSIN